MDTTLVIMAAGLGSRYSGGIKQLARVGVSDEILMDFSIYDALRAGFNKVVFVIRRDIEKDFREIIGNRIEKKCKVEYVFQELDALPEGYKKPEARTKPWGTGHAILMCKGVVNEPFAVINADDFYGYHSFKNLHDCLVNTPKQDGIESIYLSGYILGNTLSENGGVSRGVCTSDENGNLLTVTETKNIRRENGVITCEGGAVLAEDTAVSMNMWGLQPSFIDRLEEGFKEFLDKLPEGDITAEYFLPGRINELIDKKRANAKIIMTDDVWFGLTYSEDLPATKAAVAKLVADGVYPEKL